MINTNLPKDFKSISIKLASPRAIRNWAERVLPDGTVVGKVTKSETINYRTFKPEPDGLFCEKIFGPVKNWECYCGKTKHTRPYQDDEEDELPPEEAPAYCPYCHVEITESTVRRYRMGYIQLAAPVVHIWYLKSIPSYLAILLEMRPKDLEQIIYFAHFSGQTEEESVNMIPKGKWYPQNWFSFLYYSNESHVDDDEGEADTLLSYAWYIDHSPWTELISWRSKYRSYEESTESFGAHVISQKLEEIDVDKTIKSRFYTYCFYPKTTKDIEDPKEAAKMIKKKKEASRFLNLLYCFQKSRIDPRWMVIDVLPVLPPELRPMVQLANGRFAASDLNDLYRRVINRNNRLTRFLEIPAPKLVIRNEKRLLQEGVDALIDNGRRGPTVLGSNKRPLKSLADSLGGKQGRFRQNLLGKRVDYSGRSVIVVGPSLQLHQCGLPKEMALELFRPFLIRRLLQYRIAQTMRGAKERIEVGGELIDYLLKLVIKSHSILLNRAPTLHRLGFQAFQPIIIQGRAIQLHPLVCPAFNADFDGDQMAVHIPLSVEAQIESRLLMLATNNWLSPSNGEPILLPSQDMVLGCYFLTIEDSSLSLLGKEKTYLTNYDQAHLLFHKNKEIHEHVWFKCSREQLQSYVPEEEPLEIRISQHKVHSVYTRVQMKRPQKLPLPTQNHISPPLHDQLYIRTTVGRLLFNQIIEQALHVETTFTSLDRSSYQQKRLANTSPDLGSPIEVEEMFIANKKVSLVQNLREITNSELKLKQPIPGKAKENLTN